MAGFRHELSSGNWIELRPIQTLKQRDKDVYDGAIKLYVDFDDEGKPDMSRMPLSMSIQKVRRNALFARLVVAWSFTADDDITPLPVPRWISDDAGVENEDSIGDLPIDDGDEIWELMAPYITKCDRKPDPKGTTTDGSNGTSKAKAGASRRA
jgi:hypothetical protein